jgi:hypothetical protein
MTNNSQQTVILEYSGDPIVVKVNSGRSLIATPSKVEGPESDCANIQGDGRFE